MACRPPLVVACQLSCLALGGILVPRSGINPVSTSIARQILNRWTIEEAVSLSTFQFFFFFSVSDCNMVMVP